MKTSECNAKVLSNRYYICKKQQETIPWNPSEDQKAKLDYNSAYFSKVFQIVEQQLSDSNLTFYFTRDLYKLPSYGENVVAIVQGDEWCRIPTYSHRVRAVFKCYGTCPILGFNPVLEFSLINFLTLIRFFKVCIQGLPGFLNHKLQLFKGWVLKTGKISRIYSVPVGYDKQLDLPIKDFGDRLYDVFLDGSIVHQRYSVWSLKRWLGNPKLLSRKKMLVNAEKLKAKFPHLNIQLTTTAGFHDTKSDDSRRYSENMMNAKICLVPRGTTFETCRFYEAMRYGCVVISEVLPSRWHLDRSPAIQLKNWDQLEYAVSELLNDEQLMRKKHQEALEWWNSTCAEAALGNYIADQLNQLEETKSGTPH